MSRVKVLRRLRVCTFRQSADNVISAAVFLTCLQVICPIARAADGAGSFVAYSLGNRPRAITTM